MPTTKQKKYSHALLALYMIIYVIWFIILEHIYPTAETCIWTVQSTLDQKIPFCEWFIFPYIMWYPFMAILAIYLCFTDADSFRRFAWFIIIGFSTCLLFCTIVPNWQPLRPETFPRDNIATHIIAKIYSTDTNTNVFPSMHIVGTLATVCAALYCKSLRRHKWLLAIIVILGISIIASVVLVKQHSVLDIYSGIALSALLWYFIYYRRLRMPFSPRSKNYGEKGTLDSQS